MHKRLLLTVLDTLGPCHACASCLRVCGRSWSCGGGLLLRSACADVPCMTGINESGRTCCTYMLLFRARPGQGCLPQKGRRPASSACDRTQLERPLLKKPCEAATGCHRVLAWCGSLAPHDHDPLPHPELRLRRAQLLVGQGGEEGGGARKPHVRVLHARTVLHACAAFLACCCLLAAAPLTMGVERIRPPAAAQLQPPTQLLTHHVATHPGGGLGPLLLLPGGGL